MRQCKHPNIVQFYTAFVTGKKLWVVMQLMDCGSVLDVLRYWEQRKEGGVLSEPVIATILRDVLLALDYFHKNGQMHRDLKAGNILLSSSGAVALAGESWSGPVLV